MDRSIKGSVQHPRFEQGQFVLVAMTDEQYIVLRLSHYEDGKGRS